MTEVKEVLPELMAGLFARIRAELADLPMDGLRFSHVRVLGGVPEEGASVTAIAEQIGMTKQGCGQFVAQLTASGHLVAVADPTDRRVRLVRRTPEGDAFVARVVAATAVVEERFAEEVGPRRYASFRRVLDELVADPR
ncbi:MarR family winged helix-turn-helix transcriptional regulator [Phycicoccus sonneratiae]|uniref:MarR family transcriptional regulator n=1 Tax=Phycicoccus sonneratiae TaxID=2807628 RepID=A0ABS2CL05_9MICO|nr:MarR family transcriptional regulator [Phycicoccus sonneraticus]MBM6400508.1 MarR family transcriptional regulator [Phycicoccus sonneraticus]